MRRNAYLKFIIIIIYFFIFIFSGSDG